MERSLVNSVVDNHEVNHEETEAFQRRAISSTQPNTFYATQDVIMQEAQDLLQGLGGRDQEMEHSGSRILAENSYNHASKEAHIASSLPSASVPAKISTQLSLSRRSPSTAQQTNSEEPSSSTWFIDSHAAGYHSPSTHYPNQERATNTPPTALSLHVGQSLSKIDVNISTSRSISSPVRKLPQIPPSPYTQLNNSQFVSPLSSNFASKLAVVSSPHLENSQTPISALSPKTVQQATSDPGGVSPGIGAADEGHMGAHTGPLVSLVTNAEGDAIQAIPLLVPSTSTSMSATSGLGPSTAQIKTSSSPAQPVSILKNKHARHPSGSSLSVSMRLPPFHSGAVASPGTYFTSIPSTIHQSSSSLSPPTSTSMSPWTSSPVAQLPSTSSPHSTTTVSSVSMFSFSPHPGSATSSVATSPSFSPLVTENAEMTDPSIQPNLNINGNHLPKSSKSKGKQKEIFPSDELKNPTRPLPLIPPVGTGARTQHAEDSPLKVSSAGFSGPVGFSAGALTTVGSTTSSARTSTSTSTGLSSIPGSARSSLSQPLLQATSPSSSGTSPLQPALRSSLSSSSLSSRYATPLSSKGKLSRTVNLTTNGPPPSSSSNLNHPPSTSSAKSPIPSSWASRPVDLHSQRPHQSNVQHGFTATTPYSYSPSQPQLSSQQSRPRVSSGTGKAPTTSSTTTSTPVPVLPFGNRSRSGSGSMGVGGSGMTGVGSPRNVMGARARSHSRTRTAAGMMSAGIGGTSGASRAASREREGAGAASSLKSLSVPSTPVMNGMQIGFLSGSGATGSASGSRPTGTSANATTPTSRQPRALPSPVLMSKGLSNFALSSSDVLSAKHAPRRTPTFDQIVIASGSGASHHSPAKPAKITPSPASSITRNAGHREPSLPRHNASTTSRNTSPSPRRLPQPSLAAHIASLSVSPPSIPQFSSSLPASALAPIPRSVQSSLRDVQNHVAPAAQLLIVPSNTTASGSPITPAGESPLHSHPMLGGLSPDDLDDDDDRSSLSSFRAAPHGGHSRSEVKAISDSYDGPSGAIVLDEGASTKEVFDHRDHLGGYVDGYLNLSRSPSPMRYARPEEEGLFSSSEDGEMDMKRRRGRRGREGGVRPSQTMVVGVTTDSDAGPSESGDGGDVVGGYTSDGEMARGRRRTQPRAFRNSYRTGPFGGGVEPSSEAVLEGPPVDIGDDEQLPGNDRLWRISKTKGKGKAKAKANDGDMDKVVKAKDKAMKAKLKKSYFDFDFDYMPVFKDRDRNAGSRTTSSVGVSSRDTVARDSKPNSRPSSPATDPASHSRKTKQKAGTLALEKSRGAQQSEPMAYAEDTTVFDISSSTYPTSSDVLNPPLNTGNTTTTDSSPSISSYSPKIASQSGPSAHSPYSSQSHFDTSHSTPGKPLYTLGTPSTSSIPAGPYVPPTPPFLSRRSDRPVGSAPSSPRPRQLDFQQNSEYALEMETHGVSCGLGAGLSARRGSETSSAQSSKANSQELLEPSSNSKGRSNLTSSNTAMNPVKVSAPFSVFGLSRRGSALFREKDRDSGGVKLKEKTKKGQRTTGTSSTGSVASRKASSLASLFIDPVAIKADQDASSRTDESEA